MPIQGVEQPKFIRVCDGVRLRSADDDFSFAIGWYQDPETLWLVDGDRTPYTPERLQRMYTYLSRIGELYFIEVFEEGAFKPIGDVTFWQEDMPIVIGDPVYRRKGIGRKVIAALIRRANDLGYPYLRIGEIYDWNEGSRRCFKGLGFTPERKTAKGSSWLLDMQNYGSTEGTK